MFIILGILIGFIAAIPLGPVNVFVISQTLKRDHFHGILAGLTTAILDFVFCLVALVGFVQVKTGLKPVVMSGLKVVAGLVILLISYKMIGESKTFSLPRNGDKVPAASHRSILGVCLLYFTNPSLYMFWFAVAGAVTGHSLVARTGWTTLAFAAACGGGSMLWYLALVRFVSKRQSRLHPEKFGRVLWYLGLILAAIGIYTIASIFF